MKFPRDISGRELVIAFRRLGFSVQRQTGSHVQLARLEHHTTIPMHNPIRIGTLKSILKQAGLTLDDLADTL